MSRGLTSFGSPITHLGYFRDEFVSRRRWLSERSYAGLVASVSFCQDHGHYEALPARVKT